MPDKGWQRRFDEPIPLPKGKKSERSTDVRLGAHSGLKSDITALPKSVESRCDAVALGSNISVSAPFVRRCLTGSTMAPFSYPAHR
jgi:hypothetical protein